MKTEKNEKKLHLRKSNIADLNNEEMRMVISGVAGTVNTVCPSETHYICPMVTN
jgi:hypothetical protein